jgi:hypothetical protein
MDQIELISNVRSGLLQLSLEINKERRGFGTAFLVEGGIVTNSHNIRKANYDAITLRFADTDPSDQQNYIRLLPETIFNSIVTESLESDKDFVFIKMNEPEFNNRYIFDLTDSTALSVGEKVVFLGFPFGMDFLTAHIGYVSSLHTKNGIDIIQIDGSVNGGNSGGPLLDIKSGKVAGIVTRAVTGFIEQQFNKLLNALAQNQIVLEKAIGVINLSGIDPIQSIKVSQAAMEQIARNLKRSANVGIGYAYSAKYLKESMSLLT